MADERGIEQTKELLDFIFSLIGAIKESTKDGEFTWSDGLNFIEPLKKIAPAIDDIEEVIPEIMDLDASEWNELVDYDQANFDLDTDPEDDTDIETKIAEALNLNEDSNVLEIGCGWGGFSSYAAKNFKSHIDREINV